MPADKRTAAAAAEKAPEKLKPIPLQGGLSSQLVRKFASLSVADQRRSSDGAEETNACASGTGRSGTEKISPSDFVALQRLRSSTLACRTSTAFKSSRDSGILFGDLRNSDAFKKYEEGKKKQERKDADSSSASLEEASTASSPDCSRKGDRDAKEGIKNLEDEKSVVLLPRGPVRNARSSFTAHAPYPTRSGCSVTAPVSSSIVGSHERTYYQQQCNFENANYFPGVETPLDFVNTKSSSSTPDTVQSDLGYGSSSPHQISPNAEKSSASPRDVLDDAQLPEDLSDFILEYSRQYTSTVPLPGNDAKTRSRHSSSSDTNNQTNFDSPLYRILVEDECVSPLSAKSAPQFSPVLPRAATQIPAIFEESTIESICPSINAADPGLLSIVQGRRAGPRYARNRLRSIIGDREMSEAWVWTCKCIQELRGALCYQDPDGDSLLHIVILHMDLAKIYALVEQMLKADDAYTRRAFDMPNRALETPLHLAVQKNSPEIVAYLIEAGASPNTRTLPPEQQTPLHLAASQGMSEIVEVIFISCVTGHQSAATFPWPQPSGRKRHLKISLSGGTDCGQPCNHTFAPQAVLYV
ncbi:unnamed protein product [Gongylonema pulchrum]|uniref:ANK_REP_REGION domain-containing protein n=1 Tax=Gongylonema pulchrum TaxID=637853 RepID=A0A183CV39_9BILA|nr:unnamed protein product [Gongylonema pulchrum]